MTSPAPAAGPAGDGSLRLRRAVRRRFGAPARFAERPEHRAHLREYLSDMATPYQLSLREEAFTRAEGHSYGEMAAALIDGTVQPEEPVDLLVLAFAVPDIRPGRATATYLSEVCPGQPFAFAVTDQGTAAAFTGLRLATEYARTGGCARALLVVVEQAGRHYRHDPTSAPPLPTGHAAAGLLLETSGAPDMPAVRTVRQHPDTAPERVAGLLRAEIQDIDLARSGGPGDAPHEVTVILGNGLAGLASLAEPAVRTRTAPAGQPSTGGWWELAGTVAEPHAEPRLVILAEYDPGLRYLCLSGINVPAAQSGDHVAVAATPEGATPWPQANW